MSEVRYEAHPLLFRIRPFAALSMVAILLFGFLLVLIGRYQWPSILGGLVPGVDQVDGQVVQYIGVALFGLAIVRLYLWYFPTRFERLRITDDALIYNKGTLKRSTEIKLGSVRALRVDQTPLQQMMNGCDIAVFTTGDKPELVVRGLPHPERIRTLVSGPETAPAAS